MAIDRKEIYGKVTASLIEMMREGVAPWSKPWIAFPASNGSTGKAYRGINRLSLGLAMETNGWSDPRFVTFRQCKAMGGRIIKDSKGSTIVYNKVMEVEDPKTGEVETK
jgi:antirestriction protein ArdC